MSNRVLELFSGVGGLALGLEQAGWCHVAAVEYDSVAAQSFQQNFPSCRVINEDIRNLDFREYRNQIDLLAGGPPCQPFSVAGHQRAADDARDCVPDFIRAVSEVQPKLFVMENVAGLALARHSGYLRSVVLSLERQGYKVRHAVLDAADYGVPQHRKRLIIVGSRDVPFRFSAIRKSPSAVPAKSVLTEFPPDEPNLAIVTYASNPVMRPSPFAGMLVNGGGRPINLERPSQTIPASAGGNRTHIVDWNGVLVRYHERLLAGHKPLTGVVKGVRRLSIRESARLQTFPDTFKLVGSRSAQYRQIGNAVPPKLGKVIGEALEQELYGSSGRPTDDDTLGF